MVSDPGTGGCGPVASRVGSATWRRINATCASLNFDLFMVAPRSVAHAAERENSSSIRSSFSGAGQKETKVKKSWFKEAQIIGVLREQETGG
jgi:hypothetical protein